MKINASVVTFMSPNVYRYMNVYTGTYMPYDLPYVGIMHAIRGMLLHEFN